MLISSMFGDAICRDVIPAAFPEPAEESPAKYVAVFLRAVGALGTSKTLAVGPAEPQQLRVAAP